VKSRSSFREVRWKTEMRWKTAESRARRVCFE
jgi:hypothetical protein